MLYNILYTYEDSKDGKLILRCKIPDNVFFYIDELNRYLSGFGKYFQRSPENRVTAGPAPLPLFVGVGGHHAVKGAG